VQTETKTTATPEPVGDAFVLPASFAQQRLWFLDRIEAGGAVYNVPLASRLRGPLRVEVLERALATIVERHESLRTVFALEDGIPVQVIAEAPAFALPVVDLSGEPDAEERALALATEQACEGFDLSADPLLRAQLIRIADEDHVLSLTIHHIAADAWSMGVLNRELSTLYGALAEGRDPELPELPIQYGDFAVWQRQWMEDGGLDGQLEYWERALAGAPTLLELPTDKPRPAEQSFRGTTLRRVLPAELLAGLKSLGDREGATLFMTLLAAFSTLMSRYSGQQDIVVGSPVANRNRLELEGLIGLFVNTLPLRTDLSGQPSFREAIRRAREACLGGFSNQDLPFEKLVQELNPERDRSHAPLAQVLFVLQSSVEKPVTLPGLEQERVVTERGTSKFDLSLFASEVPDGLRVSIEYCTDLFEEATIERMIEHFRVLLESAVEDPDCPVDRLRIIPDSERELVLRSWNDTARPYGLDRCVHELFADQSRRTPDQIAAEFGDQVLTYAELDTAADALGRRLRELGVGPDVAVAIAADRSLEMVVGVLAILKAGGAYAPIDPSYPQERIAFMLADSGTPVLLTHQRLVDGLPEHEAHVLLLDDVLTPAPADAADDPVPAAGVTADNLAYVIYTSGSTGRPKGVAVGHRPLVNLITWQLQSLTEPVAARTLQFASLSFDVAFQEMFSTWCSGGTLVLIEDRVRRDPRALLEVLGEERLERLFLPYVGLQALCEATEHTQTSLPSLRQVITAGEQLKATEPIRRFFARHVECRLTNHYGPSESHVVTAFELPAATADWSSLPPIGRPIANARIYLLDPHREPVPVGVPGELYIGGVSLARGYLGRAELTAERFVADPFGDGPDARMYKSGDLARHLPDGNIEFLGRSDDQVKIRGFRVELGEVEAMLTRHPAVAEAVAIAREDRPGDVRLVAYVVLKAGRTEPEPDLLQHARRLVPDYLVPQHVVILPSVPLTPSGKIDRRGLPAPQRQQNGDRPAQEQSSTELERALAGIWQRLLQVDQVGLDDDFFDLGGHSLLAVQVVHAIEEELGRTCTLPMLFRSGTVRALAAELQAGGADADEPTVLQLATGSGPAVFCICGVHAYQELADELAPQYSSYGIFLPVEQELFKSGPGRGLKRVSVEEMAAGYVRTVRGEQPHGPYLLLGFCFGGILAYEAAQQLRASGEAVSMLVMLDTTLASVMRGRKRPSSLASLRRLALHHHARLPRPLQRRLLGDDMTEAKRLELIRLLIYGAAMRRYRVNDYVGATVLVRPAESVKAYAGRTDESWGWSQRVADLQICDVPGAHLSHLKRPNVRVLARSLRPLLGRARS
jgi:amino acid adenylation domain-containing protein